MVTVTTPLVERAERIFSDLGYAVSTEGSRLRAERKWRTVHVTPVSDSPTAPNTGEFHCFVAPAEEADDVRRQLADEEVDGEWAVLGVNDDGDYEVHRPIDRYPA